MVPGQRASSGFLRIVFDLDRGLGLGGFELALVVGLEDGGVLLPSSPVNILGGKLTVREIADTDA